MSAQPSRFDKLCDLIEGGKSSAIREAAAYQVVEYVKLNPTVFPTVLERVHKIICSKDWDARVSGGLTIQLLAKHVEHYAINDVAELSGLNLEIELPYQSCLDNFNVIEILNKGTILLQSSGKEYDVKHSESSLAERIGKQRAALKKRLGLEAYSGESGNFINDSDLEVQLPTKLVENKISANEVLSEVSAKQRFQMRKRMKLSRQAETCKNRKTEDVEADKKNLICDDSTWHQITCGCWPFAVLANKMLANCINPMWEVRHGALIGLRELLTHHVQCASINIKAAQSEPTGWIAAGGSGKILSAPMTKEATIQQLTCNRMWLDDCLIHILCVLALDRFADFVSDKVVAPVRETAAQVLSCLSVTFSFAEIQKILSFLFELTRHEQWGVRYAGVLGLKYIFAANARFSKRLLDESIDVIMESLQDEEEDVRSVAAEAMIPLANVLTVVDIPILLKLHNVLWKNISIQDSLNSSTGCILQLLAQLLPTLPKTALESYNSLIKLLWPLFRSNISIIRKSLLDCLLKMIESFLGVNWLDEDNYLILVLLIYQNLCLELNNEIYKASKRVWKALILNCTPELCCRVLTDDVVKSLFDLAMVDNLQNLERQIFFENVQKKIVCNSNAVIDWQLLLDNLDIQQNAFKLSHAISVLCHNWKADVGRILNIMQTYLESNLSAKHRTISMVFVYWSQEAMSISNKFCEGDVSKTCLVNGQNFKDSLHGIEPETYVEMLSSENMARLVSSIDCEGNSELSVAKNTVQLYVEDLVKDENALHANTTSLMAAAVVHIGPLPEKINVCVQPLMAYLKKFNGGAVNLVSDAIAVLVYACAHRITSPNDKIISNLVESVSTFEESEGDRLKDNQAANALKSGAQPKFIKDCLGAEQALIKIFVKFKMEIFQKLPTVVQVVESGHKKLLDKVVMTDVDVVRVLRLFQVIANTLYVDLCSWILQQCPMLLLCIKSESEVIRVVASQCIASIVKCEIDTFLPYFLRFLLPLCDESYNAFAQHGAIASLYEIIKQLEEKLVPYAMLLLMPVMKYISSQNLLIRSLSAASFSILVSVLPLAQGLTPPKSLNSEQKDLWLQEYEFVDQLLNNKKIKHSALPTAKELLRPYQLEGVSWLLFLEKSGLNGILADDMGLGKTAQASTVLAASHLTYKLSSQENISIIICPQILVQHWVCEIDKFFESNLLNALAYEGNISQRQLLRPKLGNCNIIVMSYETVRADIDWVLTLTLNYCILDEGHVIKNPKSKISQVVKQIQAKRRLILTGTPIQNDATELWNLFDFLMPGFLGCEATFRSRFGKLTHAARYATFGSKESQEGLLAMNNLHKQVKPFILRRTKDMVLKDLPPKIIQDIYCNMTPLQSALYDSFSASDVNQNVMKSVSMNDSSKTPHIFQALQYLRKLCSHPLMVLRNSNKSHVSMLLEHADADDWDNGLRTMHSLSQSPKLFVLQQILQQCNVCGFSDDFNVEDVSSASVSNHRILVFAQFREMLDLVEMDVLRPNSVTYLRVDGSIESSLRFANVQRFNEDPSISVLLLTTSIGGMGLNLTTADTVIFLEHDWNPMKDLQAMDRAHRLGQKRTVNVYRLLMRNTLEEKIMKLQNFKKDMAGSIVNQDNVSLKTMNASLIFDMLDKSNEVTSKDTELSKKKLSGQGTNSINSVVTDLQSLWDEEQYTEEFSLDSFIDKLNSS